ncbi:MAG TPA: hypothetical protein VK111_00725 [Virgibacillus sp.]|nr:hypothetical protein [Virgibacillus sp.]
MKKLLVGLLFIWIFIFGFIGYTHIGDQTDTEEVEHDSVGEMIIER